MKENEINIEFSNNEYLFKMLYLIRTNLPTSEYIYIIMFLLKYIGIILFSISLNKWNNDKKFQNNAKEKNNTISIFSINSPDSIHTFLMEVI